ncbi:MAG: GIY-YIG nuclease family protein [Candidatus Acidiferrales bacterium]
MQDKFSVYILRSDTTGRFYIGHTSNLPTRLRYHNSGRTISGKNRGPWQVVYQEDFSNRSAAVRRERQMKSWKSHRYVELILQETAREG